MEKGKENGTTVVTPVKETPKPEPEGTNSQPEPVKTPVKDSKPEPKPEPVKDSKPEPPVKESKTEKEPPVETPKESKPEKEPKPEKEKEPEKDSKPKIPEGYIPSKISKGELTEEHIEVFGHILLELIRVGIEIMDTKGRKPGEYQIEFLNTKTKDEIGELTYTRKWVEPKELAEMLNKA